MFETFDEFQSLHFQDIKDKSKHHGKTDCMKTEYPYRHSLHGGGGGGGGGRIIKSKEKIHKISITLLHYMGNKYYLDNLLRLNPKSGGDVCTGKAFNPAPSPLPR